MTHILALCGGVGGAKLAHGLARALPPEAMTLIVNTGDDWRHLGLHISPDIDTVTYTLAGLSDQERGWGLAGETWGFMGALARLGGEDWFQLGDKDLATHVERTRRLAAGDSLSAITADFGRAQGLKHALHPMSDDPVETIIATQDGDIAFQDYFVRRRCAPRADAIYYRGADTARPAPGFKAALERRDVTAVLICPSNPYLSIGPILAIPGVRAGLKALEAPIVAVSPIIGGDALKGPAAKLMREFGAAPGNPALADYYDGLLTGLMIDARDEDDADALRGRGLVPFVTDTIMRTDEDRLRLAGEALSFASSLRVEGTK